MKKERIYHSYEADPEKMYNSIKNLINKTSANNKKALSDILKEGMKITIDNNDNVNGVQLDFENLILKSDTEKQYLIKMKEDAIFFTNKAKVFKFSNEIRSKDNNFFIRFDFERNDIYPNYHINAPEEIYGSYHLIPCPYPGWEGDCHTNLDIRKLSPLKSLKIFMLFIKSKEDPIRKEENKKYIEILEKGDRI